MESITICDIVEVDVECVDFDEVEDEFKLYLYLKMNNGKQVSFHFRVWNIG